MCKKDGNVSPYLRRRLRTHEEFLREQDRNAARGGAARQDLYNAPPEGESASREGGERDSGSGSLPGANSAQPVERLRCDSGTAVDRMTKASGSKAYSGHGAISDAVDNRHGLDVESAPIDGRARLNGNGGRG